MSLASAVLTFFLLSSFKSLKMDIVPSNYTGASFVPNLISQKANGANEDINTALLHNGRSDTHYYGST